MGVKSAKSLQSQVHLLNTPQVLRNGLSRINDAVRVPYNLFEDVSTPGLEDFFDCLKWQISAQRIADLLPLELTSINRIIGGSRMLSVDDILLTICRRS